MVTGKVEKVLSQRQLKSSLDNTIPFETVNGELRQKDSNLYKLFKQYCWELLVNRLFIPKDIVNQLLEEDGMNILIRGMTHFTIDEDYNSEIYECIGEGTYNKLIMDQIIKKHPNLLQDPQGSQKITESIKLFRTTERLSKYCKIMGLEKFYMYQTKSYKIIYKVDNVDTVNIRQIKLEDNEVMKANIIKGFIGALQDLIDGKWFNHFGIIVCNTLIETILFNTNENIEIDLSETKSYRQKLDTICQQQWFEKPIITKLMEGNDILYVKIYIKFNRTIYGNIKGKDVALKEIIFRDFIQNGDIQASENKVFEKSVKLLKLLNIEYVAPQKFKNLPRQLPQSIVNKKEEYKQYICSIIRDRGGFEIDDSIIGEKEMKLIFQSFTHRTYDESHNYESFETIGDKSYNMITLYYLSRRFPELWNFYDAKYYLQEASKKYQSKDIAPILADDLRLMNYVIKGEKFINSEEALSKLKTDCLESFLYIITKIINDHFGEHVGYSVVYKIIESCFDKIHMSVDPNVILGNKVKLKELLEKYFKPDNYYDKNTLIENKYQVRISFTKPYPFTDGAQKDLIFNDVNDALEWFESKNFIWKP